MKKLLSILIFLFVTQLSYGQTFTQTFVDRCTGEVQIVTANFQTGSAVVSFYNKVKLFTYQQYTNGELQQWLAETYAWWNALSPCSTAQAQTTQAQQTANNVANNVANTTNTSSSNSVETGSTNTTETSNTTSNESSSTESSSSETSESSGETESSESKEESKTEESKEEETKEEESKEEESSDDEKEEEEKKEKERKFNPIQLKADMLTMQSIRMDYNAVLNVGASQSSIYGDRTNSANLMIWDNLNQASISLNSSVVSMSDDYQVSWVDSYGVSYMRNYGMNVLTATGSRMKPLGKWGTFGVGVNYSYMFGKDSFGGKMPDIYSLGYNFLYTNSFQLTDRILYSPAIIGAQNPITYISKSLDSPEFTSTTNDFIGILANSFTIQLTRRFSFNVGWTLIYSSNEFVPLMNSFMIGAKLPF